MSGQIVTIIRRAWNGPFTILPNADDTEIEGRWESGLGWGRWVGGAVPLPSPLGEVIDINACITFVRVGAGWRKVRAKLRSWLMRFEDWGSV